MNKEQITKSGQDKIKAIQKLCEQLQITLSAQQHINNNGFIENVIFYMDTEKYEEDINIPQIKT